MKNLKKLVLVSSLIIAANSARNENSDFFTTTKPQQQKRFYESEKSFGGNALGVSDLPRNAIFKAAKSVRSAAEPLPKGLLR